MANSLEKSIGDRLKEFRKNRGFTMRDLAERCNLSVNAISLIERGENSPTVSSLKRLSSALGVSMNELLEKTIDSSIVHIKKNQGMHIHKNNFEIESLGFGLADQQIDPYRIIINPGVDTSSKVITHPGQEFVFCLSGLINYYVGDQQFKLESGDSLLFNAMYPHGWCNPNSVPVELIIIFHSHNEPFLAHQRHSQIDDMEA